MDIARAGTRPSGKGPSEWFTGTVRLDPPNEKHWHGASPATAMSHIAIQEALDGKVVDWMEHVTDEQYGAKREAPRHP